VEFKAVGYNYTIGYHTSLENVGQAPAFGAALVAESRGLESGAIRFGSFVGASMAWQPHFSKASGDNLRVRRWLMR
jgi:hypothetical protein